VQVRQSIAPLRRREPRLKLTPRTTLAVLALAWALCLVSASLFANRAKHAVSTGVQISVSKHSSPRVVIPPRHRILHFLSFGLLALLLVLPAPDVNSRLLVTLAVAALGLGIECAQHCIFGNNFEWWDVRDDSLGAIGAFFITSLPALRRRNIRRSLFKRLMNPSGTRRIGFTWPKRLNAQQLAQTGDSPNRKEDLPR
jgi:hypothetical protein